jgi:hypothetical protein
MPADASPYYSQLPVILSLSKDQLPENDLGSRGSGSFDKLRMTDLVKEA